MKTAGTLLIIVFSLSLLAKDKPFVITRMEDGKTVWQLQADSISQKEGPGPAVILSGHATLTTNLMTVSADEMEFKPENGQIEPHGNVRIQIAHWGDNMKSQASKP